MSVFNVSQNEATAANAVERNTSGDRLNENVPNASVIGQPLATIANRNNGINNNPVSGSAVSAGGGGISGFGGDLCSDSEEDCERTAKKLAVNEWLTNYEDVSMPGRWKFGVQCCLSSICRRFSSSTFRTRAPAQLGAASPRRTRRKCEFLVVNGPLGAERDAQLHGCVHADGRTEAKTNPRDLQFIERI